MSIDAPAGTTVLINVSGNRDYVIFNLYEAESLTITGMSFEGSILAPRADLDFVNGSMNGQLIVDNWIVTVGTGGEMHQRPFVGCPWVCP